MRKLQSENSALSSDNKILKDKLNRCNLHVMSLEHKLAESNRERDKALSYLDGKISESDTKHLCQSETTEWEQRIVKLKKRLDSLKTENMTLERELALQQKCGDAVTGHGPRVLSGYQLEVTTLKDDLNHAKKLLRASEADCERLGRERSEAAAQVVKLNEAKALLQQQLDDSASGSVAEKQLCALKVRLQITEDRLFQERANRAGKLSEVEEKLLAENARLKVIEKVLRKQKDHLCEKIARYTNMRKKAWHVNTGDLCSQKSDRDSACLDICDACDWKTTTLDEMNQEKEELDKVTKEQIHSLVHRKFDTVCQIKNLEDKNAAIQGENDALQTMLNTLVSKGPNPSSQRPQCSCDIGNGTLSTFVSQLFSDTVLNCL
ncbi:hypothetical protein NP493_1079g00026 [Ridgeia piscesae]|uniref:Uncharacterized protein n=1 Tax=Ridgeia piscesae TaxID=27915 RepID=A0AAD9KGR0_RIDPI|nr:hypothetical protein NP493_1079g00026 [Ridgeia piscesae]